MKDFDGIKMHGAKIKKKILSLYVLVVLADYTSSFAG